MRINILNKKKEKKQNLSVLSKKLECTSSGNLCFTVVTFTDAVTFCFPGFEMYTTNYALATLVL